MKKVTVMAAALAAGLTSLASISHADTERGITYQEFLKASKLSVAPADGIDETTTASTDPDASGKAARSPYDAIIAKHASANGIPIELAHAVISVESNYRADARGQAGELGLMQIKPATARMMGFTGANGDLHDPEINIRYGMKYLAKAQQLGGGDTCGTILRYNAGHGASRMNPISAAYCAKVKRQLSQT